MTGERVQPDPERLLRAALKLASGGIPVFPCVPGEKRPLTAHGFLDASNDPDQIRAWWKANPTANLAFATGSNSFDVLDVDIRPSGSGFEALARLADTDLIDGHRLEVATPSGGTHLYFAGSSQSSGQLANHHLDFKANGGYVLAPPSVVDGAQYRMTRYDTEHLITPLNWQAVKSHLQAPPRPPRPAVIARRNSFDLEKVANWVSRLPEGHRNTGLFWAACRAAEHGYHDLSPLIRSAMTAGLPEIEATRTVASAQRRIGGTARGHPDHPRPAPKPPQHLHLPRPRRSR